jgi:hypothetical protein
MENLFIKVAGLLAGFFIYDLIKAFIKKQLNKKK